MQIRDVFGLMGVVAVVLTGCQLSGDYVPYEMATPPKNTAWEESRREYRRMGPIPKPDPRAEALWGTDLREALARAQINGKRVLLDFTRSDSGYVNVRWDYFYTQSKFLDLAEQKLELVKVDSGRDSNPSSESKKLAELFGVISRPRYFILNAEGEIVWPKKELFGSRIKGVHINLGGVKRTTASDMVPQSVFYFEREKRFIERLKLILDDREPTQGQAPIQLTSSINGTVEKLVRKRFGWAMQDGKFTDEGLAKVGQLFFTNTDLQNTDLKDLSKYPQLSSLGINRSPQVTDEGIRELAKIKQIKKLTLSGPWITDSTLGELGKLTHLEKISVYKSKVTGDGYAKLQHALPGCNVYVDWTPPSNSRRKFEILLPLVPATLSGDDRAELIRAAVGKAIGRPANQVTQADWQKPTELNFIFSKITDDCLKEVGALRQLKKLQLDNTRITDEGLKELNNLTQFEHLGFSGTYVTDNGIQHLHNFKSLTSVTLGRTNVTPDGVAALKRALPKCDIHYFR